MIERDYVEKVMKTWNPHVPDSEVESTYKYMQEEWQEHVKHSLQSKMEEYEAAGIPPGPAIEQLEGAFIEKAALKSVIDIHLGEYLEEIEKRRRGHNRDYYAHLWTIQDPDGWRKTPWETDINPQLAVALIQSFPEEGPEFYVFTAARIERELYETGEMPEISETFLEEVREAIAEWEAAGASRERLSFADVRV